MGISVKASRKRLSLPDSPQRSLPPFFARLGLNELPVSMAHSFGVYDLPPHHSHPFDRLSISQALCEDMTLVSSDCLLADYPVKLVLLK